MGIKETETKEVSANQYCAAVIQKTNNMELQLIERDGMIDTLLKYFADNAAVEGKGSEEVISGYIDKLAKIDARFDQYKR